MPPKHQQSRRHEEVKPVEVEETVTAETPSAVEEAPAAPVVAPVAAPATAPVVEAVAAPLAIEPEKLVKIRPTTTVPSCHIGGKRYTFVAGVEIKVPENVRNFLAERHMI